MNLLKGSPCVHKCPVRDLTSVREFIAVCFVCFGVGVKKQKDIFLRKPQVILFTKPLVILSQETITAIGLFL